MKKLFAFILGVLMFLPFAVKADMGAPGVKNYKVSPRSKSGAPYYDYSYDNNKAELVKDGTVEYGEYVKVYEERDFDGVLYGYGSYGNVDCFIKLSDFKLDDEDDILVPLDKDEKLYKARLFKNLDIYNGPSRSYSTIGKLKAGTEVNVTYFLGDGYWVYVVTDDAEGYLDASDSALGLLRNDKLIYEKTGKIYEDFYELEPWSGGFMVKEDGEYIKLDKYKTGSSFVGDKESVTSKEVVLYETIPEESDVITAKKVATVPKNAQVSIEYIQNGSFRGSIYIDYKGTKGWTTIEDSVDAIDYSYPDDYDYMEVYVESGDVVEPSPEKPRPKVKRDKTKLSTKDIIIVSCVGGGIVVLSSVITIIAVNKKKEVSAEN